MMTPVDNARSYRARWLISAPCADESLHSVLHRAADLYEQRPDTMWTSLLDEAGEPPCAVDDPTPGAVDALAQALDVSSQRLDRLRLPSGEHGLAHGTRHAYCPRCWRGDDAAGRPRHFRRAWAGVLALRCDTHRTPLVAWRTPRGRHAAQRSDDISLAELLIDAIDTQAEVHEALDAIHTFARTLSACLDGAAQWPTDWHGTACEARDLLIHVMTPDGPAESSWLSQTYTSPALRPFIHPGPNRPEAGSSEGWERLRRTGDPATRRMALWLVGSWLVPHWSDRYRSPLPRP